MYRWKRNKRFSNVNAQLDLMIVVMALRYETNDGERINMSYSIPVETEQGTNIESFKHDDDYITYLEFGNVDGFST